MDQGASIIFISLFSGFNIAFAILSFFIWASDKSQKLYLYFGIFSLFSGLYFLLIGLSVVFELEMHYAIIFCAAIYYGIFPWLIFELIENKQRTTSSILSFIFAFAFFVLLIYPDESDYALWQIIAHIGLLGLCLTTAYTSIIFKKKEIKRCELIRGIDHCIYFSCFRRDLKQCFRVQIFKELFYFHGTFRYLPYSIYLNSRGETICRLLFEE